MTAEPKKSKKSTKSEKSVKTRKKDELTLGKRSLDTPMPKGAALYRSVESKDYYCTLIKKKITFSSYTVYKEIQVGSGAKSYLRKGFRIYEEMRKKFYHIVSHK
jgi:hypothetical protein